VTENPENTRKNPSPEEVRVRIIQDWTDYNGHLNVTWITYLFDLATDNLLDWLGVGESYACTEKRSTFALEAHLRYLGEAHEGEEVTLRSWLLGADDKRIHYVHELATAPDCRPVATIEQLSIHVDLASRRAAVWSFSQEKRFLAAKADSVDIPFCGAIRLKGGM
jgi:acyl-CoA thioester hydrolase